MPASSSIGDLVIRTAGAEEFRAVRRALREAGDPGKGLRRQLNKQIRQAADAQVLPALRGAALSLPDVSSARRRDGTSIRTLIAKAVQVTTTDRGVKIIVNRRKLPKGSDMLPHAFEKGSWRHPVFANPNRSRSDWRWVVQKGKPWFRPTILRYEPAFRRAVLTAMEDTIRQLERQ